MARIVRPTHSQRTTSASDAYEDLNVHKSTKVKALVLAQADEIALFYLPPHAPELNTRGHVTTRYYGWYANRPHGIRRKAEPGVADAPPAIVPAPRLAPTEATREWAALLLQIFLVDPLACPTGHDAMRVVAVITQTLVIGSDPHPPPHPRHTRGAGCRPEPKLGARRRPELPRPPAPAVLAARGRTPHTSHTSIEFAIPCLTRP